MKTLLALCNTSADCRCFMAAKSPTSFRALLAAEPGSARLHTLCIPFPAKIRSNHP